MRALPSTTTPLPKREGNLTRAVADTERHPVAGVLISQVFDLLIAVIIASHQVQVVGHSVGDPSSARCSAVRGNLLAEAGEAEIAAAERKTHLANPGIAVIGAAVLSLRGQIDAVAGGDGLQIGRA